MHGTNDAIIPWTHSQALYDAAGPQRTLWLVDGAVHTGLHNHDPAEWERRVLAFIHDAVVDWQVKS